MSARPQTQTIRNHSPLDGMGRPSPQTDAPARSGAPLTRPLWLVLGFVCVGLAFVGAVLPLMPTTIFLIFAAACFARSSPRFETWLLNHKQFGPTLRAWRAEGAIGRRGKTAACVGMAGGYGMFWIAAHPSLVAASLVGGVMAACAAYVLSRPAPSGR